MPFRVWVGFWTALFIFLIVAFDLSALVRYITRFTEESFACLIALIFIYEAFKKTFEIEHKYPVDFHPSKNLDSICQCIIGNGTGLGVSLNLTTLEPNFTTTTVDPFTTTNSTSLSYEANYTDFLNITSFNTTTTTEAPQKTLSALAQKCLDLGGELQGQCEDKHVPDAFFFSLILFFGTFFLATSLVHFRHSLFFPTFVSVN